ncbi:protein of unknown function [Methylocella tundrae]|uniref:Uncharacterized protein n=1 Tax=Methylocella tundrae TaxID=227605 RepID=A0A4U8YVX5_METTU|nr:protein of unknown function [Methylocella tundrae]
MENGLINPIGESGLARGRDRANVLSYRVFLRERDTASREKYGGTKG